MTRHRPRAVDVYEHFCDCINWDYMQDKFDSDAANRMITEKREALESRWGVKLPVYTINATQNKES